MKIHKSILFFLLVALALIACSPNEKNTGKEVSITDQELPQSVGLEVGNILEIVLPANPSTGYSWEVGFYNSSMLKPSGEPEFIQQDASLGAEGVQKLHFEAIGAGENELVLVYRRSFEKDLPELKTFNVDVTVK